MQIKVYYQIDYLGDDGATYIASGEDPEDILKQLDVMNKASRSITGKSKFVLDMYCCLKDPYDNDVYETFDNRLIMRNVDEYLRGMDKAEE